MARKFHGKSRICLESRKRISIGREIRTRWTEELARFIKRKPRGRALLTVRLIIPFSSRKPSPRYKMRTRTNTAAGALANYENTASATVCARFTGMSASILAVTSLRDRFLVFLVSPSLFLCLSFSHSNLDFTTPNRTKSSPPPPLSRERIHPVTPDGIRRQCHSGQPGWLPRQHSSRSLGEYRSVSHPR